MYFLIHGLLREMRAVVAVDVLHRRVGTKKYTNTIYLITAAEDPIENPADLEATVQHMVQQVMVMQRKLRRGRVWLPGLVL